MLERLPDLDAAFASDGGFRTGLLPGAALNIQNVTEIVLAPLGP